MASLALSKPNPAQSQHVSAPLTRSVGLPELFSLMPRLYNRVTLGFVGPSAKLLYDLFTQLGDLPWSLAFKKQLQHLKISAWHLHTRLQWLPRPGAGPKHPQSGTKEACGLEARVNGLLKKSSMRAPSWLFIERGALTKAPTPWELFRTYQLALLAHISKRIMQNTSTSPIIQSLGSDPSKVLNIDWHVVSGFWSWGTNILVNIVQYSPISPDTWPYHRYLYGYWFRDLKSWILDLQRSLVDVQPINQ